MKDRTNHTCRVLALFFCLTVLAGCLFSCRGSDVPLTPGLSLIEGVPVYEDDVAMKTDHVTVTPGMMGYFFYTYGATVLAGLETQKPFDENRRLHDQMYSETQSFYDAIMSETISHISYMLICCEAARAEGVTLSEAQRTALENRITGYRMEAAASYGITIEAYLQGLYGPRMTEADLRAVLELETLANSFSTTVSKRLESGITDGQVAEYMREKGISDETPSRNIAFLFLPFEGGKPAEDKIADVSAAMTATPDAATLQSQTVGTYGEEENLTPSNSGIAVIGEWLFANGRAVGDWTRLDTEGATYMLIYTGNGMSYGEVQARRDLYDHAFSNWYNGWVEALTFGYNYDCLDSYDVD